MDKIVKAIPKAHNIRIFHFLVILESVIRINTQNLIKTAANVPKFCTAFDKSSQYYGTRDN